MLTANQVKSLPLPESPGCYQFLNSGGQVIYVGKAANLKKRVLSYWRSGIHHPPAKNAMLKQVAEVKVIETESEIEALLLEANLIKKLQPSFNIVLRDDKRHIYIHLSTEDKIPGLFLVRRLGKSGKYFGPFVSKKAVEEALRAIRKIWPFCLARKPQKRPCFYYQINRCLGVCVGLISRREYLRQVIKPIELFLTGRKSKIIKDWQKEIRVLQKQGEYDKAENLQRQLDNMNQVLAHTKILSLLDKYATDVVEVAKLLGLKRIPKRIEGYDISNIFGQEAVGAMVVFEEGEPAKNEYRRFKIKNSSGGDVAMLREMLERRFANNWPLPDLIIIDGGKAQLNMAEKVLKKNRLHIPLLAVAKGRGLRSAAAPDKIFFPQQESPLELSLHSPVLHLVKRVRDEAHRFAISYHRNIKRKKFWQ
ncbi:excinuclease ABC subunit UvrC [Candidatus Parcubacteria bacterium]|nr:MAG: excinuclease ABC subunit UvrC [Candidatus Parcubacteria bacterium]